MSAVDSQFYQKKKNSTFYVGLGFLVFTILATGWLYLYTSSIKEENAQISEQIQTYNASIEAERSDENVQIYSIYEKHKGLLESTSKRSEIPLFVSHLKKNFQKYWVIWKGFDYNDGVVLVEMESKTGESEYAYQRIVKMLREYPLDEKALFEIWEVTTFSGHDQITYTAEFRLK